MGEIAELSEMRFGIELETVGITRKDTVSAILGVVGGEVQHEGGSSDKWLCTASDGRKWNAVSDASIGRGNAEVVSSILTYPADVPILQNVIRAIRKAGGKVNSSCGIHVHADASYLNGRQLGDSHKICLQTESLILHALQFSQSRLNFYTKPPAPSFSARYDMRIYLLGVGAIGDEFKTMRHFLLENMPGCASYKHKSKRTAP